ncbi:MAG: VWA domain-containing protein, partial [Lachnospiraceae bacterium]|nr:VWA domain-containing protein [Lachnospiraceae bacterium]
MSKLIALLLVLALCMSTGISAVAEAVQDINTKTEYFEQAKEALNNAIMGTGSWWEYWAIVENISEEDFSEFYDVYLNDEEREAMATDVTDMFWDACIGYSVVAPFLPPVNVAQTRARLLSVRASTDGATATPLAEETTENGLIINKTASYDEETNKYTITLDAFVTGNVTTQTVEKNIPCDITMVLDFSNSMSQDLSGGANGGMKSRLIALQTAVNTFIQETSEKYDAQTADHRISLVTYNGTARV